jgi:hypothetical protein
LHSFTPTLSIGVSSILRSSFRISMIFIADFNSVVTLVNSSLHCAQHWHFNHTLHRVYLQNLQLTLKSCDNYAFTCFRQLWIVHVSQNWLPTCTVLHASFIHILISWTSFIGMSHSM